ncbi:NAD(P)/FAD-dependent oxidoreductase [Jiangella aurantiaca]|uniref:NAD(P)/FAD-dependent oxidoreductase n=1 Tax=Jiangella aurantiaca TaxID=2530373 RepID=A0A4R5A6H2_9ACTN|nr:FAD-dependent oxidoreductase [Jiangella aurantiaca]TDD67663.1 NAD(P)/FAD-dependent oxidoreductase [Jiangella aurantiaca]
MSEVDVVVIGAGQAGLSTAYHLRRLGVSFVVLDGADGPGGAWGSRPPTLTMAKVHGVFDLPGAHRPAVAGEGELPASEVVGRYYADYERRFELPVLRPVRVTSVEPLDDGRLLVRAADGRTWTARAVANATGTWTRPHWPYYPGAAEFRRRQLHSSEYRGPAAFAGSRVVVVGGGNSAAHILSEIADVAASVTWVTRRPPEFRSGEFSPEVGRSIIADVEARVRAGLPPLSVVAVTGLGYTEVVHEAMAKGVLNPRPMFARLVPGGAEFADGSVVEADTIVWATGFRAALGHLAPLHLREPGGGVRMDGTRVVRDPRIHLVGYGPSASTVGANRAGRDAAVEIKEFLAAAAALPAA